MTLESPNDNNTNQTAQQTTVNTTTTSQTDNNTNASTASNPTTDYNTQVLPVANNNTIQIQPANNAGMNTQQQEPIPVPAQTAPTEVSQSTMPQPMYGAYAPTQQLNTISDTAPQYQNQNTQQFQSFNTVTGSTNSNQPQLNANNANTNDWQVLPPTESQAPTTKPVKQSKPATTRTVITSSIITGVITLLLSGALIGSGAITVPTSADINSIGSTSQSTTNGNGSNPSVTSDTADWESVIKKVSPSVVSIQTQLSNGVAAGSGAIIDANNGYIITNNHVVKDAKTIYVTLSNGQIYEGTLKGSDATTDIAIVKLNNVPKGLKAVSFADSDALQVGQPTMAIGNPLGYANSASTGIISALNRPVSVSSDGNAQDAVVTNAIQVDAAVNQGNSGGPLFNASGEVIGITSSIASVSNNTSSAGSIGIGFAIPSNLVKKVGESIIKDGSFTHAQLGVAIKTGTVKVDNVTRIGAYVSSVVSGGAADKAGIKMGDVIVAYNGNAIESVESVLGYVRAASVGDKAKLTIVRNGTNVINITVTLGKATEKTQSTQSQNNNGLPGLNDNNDDNDSNDDNDNSSNGLMDHNDDNSDDLDELNQFFGNGNE